MNKKARYFGLILILVSTLMLGACGGGGGGGSTGGSTSTYAEYVYVTNTADNNVSQFKISSRDGTLSGNSPATIDTGQVQNWIALDPQQTYAYITHPGITDNISQYRIENDGTLTWIADNATGNNPWGAVIEPSGNYLYVANSSDNSISQFTIMSGSGLLVANGMAPTPTSSPTFPEILTIDPSGGNLYAAYFTSNVIVQFSIQSDGTLNYVNTTNGTLAAPISSPNSLAITPDGKFLYVSNQDINEVSYFSIDQNTGALAGLGKVLTDPDGSTSPDALPSSISIDSTGSYLYVANEIDDSVAVYSIAADGSLTVVEYELNVTGAYALAISPGGQYLYVTDDTNDKVNQFSIDTNTGAITPIGTPQNAISLPEYITTIGITR